MFIIYHLLIGLTMKKSLEFLLTKVPDEKCFYSPLAPIALYGSITNFIDTVLGYTVIMNKEAYKTFKPYLEYNTVVIITEHNDPLFTGEIKTNTERVWYAASVEQAIELASRLPFNILAIPDNTTIHSFAQYASSVYIWSIEENSHDIDQYKLDIEDSDLAGYFQYGVTKSLKSLKGNVIGTSENYLHPNYFKIRA